VQVRLAKQEITYATLQAKGDVRQRDLSKVLDALKKAGVSKVYLLPPE
jgi:biopolymer transport protein ExbD